ncbi:MAG: hypothetical protein HQL20_02190 [Candidatus Omnitrophica bacterium]|nr:hypothetical protein [Candidatus Omnitrophota bacterium]
MDILAQKRMLCVVILAGLGLAGNLASADDSARKYGLSALDYFSRVKLQDAGRAEFLADELWGEASRLPGGSVEVHYPPGPVLDFLQTPNAETGRRYLRWNELRLEKIQKAQEVLNKMIEDPPGAADVH